MTKVEGEEILPYFEESGYHKEKFYFNIYSGNYADERRLEITTSPTHTYVALHGGRNEDMVWLNVNVDRKDFVDGLLVLFPELQYKTEQ